MENNAKRNQAKQSQTKKETKKREKQRKETEINFFFRKMKMSAKLENIEENN